VKKGDYKDMKKIIVLFLVSTLIFTLTACSSGTTESTSDVLASELASGSGEKAVTAVEANQNSEVPSSIISVEYDHEDLDSSVSSSDMSYITLEGDSIIFEGMGATVNGTIITITSAGMYSISGTLDDGQIIVDTQDSEAVRLVLNGVDITCSTSAPIFVRNAEKTVITLADGSENDVTDGTSYLFDDAGADEPNAAVFSKDDLTINGNGSLTVNANYNNGIASKDDLLITGGTITVKAVNDGLKGRDSIAVKDGITSIDAGGDGMQSNNDEDPEKGYIYIEGGTFNITAGADGIQAETNLMITGGSITIGSGGGSINSSNRGNEWGDRGLQTNINTSDSTISTKGIKAGVDLTITGGTFDIDSSDDSLHSNDSLTISAGNFTLASGDDGIHSDSSLEINDGEISITKCYEGLESAVITINDGNIHIVASDDGINVVSESGGDFMGGRPGQGEFSFSGDNYLYVNGGYIVSDAGGDGLDINGSIQMAGGVVIIHGPISNNNGALDYLGAFDITGGFLVAVGSAGMAQAPSVSSTQYAVIVNFQSMLSAGTIVHIETEDGEEVLTFVPTKQYQSIVLCSPQLENGSTYLVYTGGSSTGTIADGLYSGGTYTPGSQITSFAISSMVTGAGAFSGGFFGGRGGNRGEPGGQRP
jgi:hypothetical protein